jgi:hypothetical protein
MMRPNPLKPILLVLLFALLSIGCGKAPNSKDILPDTLKVKRLSKTYVITGIGLSGTNKVAIINNQVLKPGEELDQGVILVDVQETYAVILVGTVEHRIRPEDIQKKMLEKQ